MNVANGRTAVAMKSADNALVLVSAGVSGYQWIQTYGGALTLNPRGYNAVQMLGVPNLLLVPPGANSVKLI